MINIQPIEKFKHSDGSTLDVHSIFYTIQGEGPYAGCPAVFIRLAGCNLQCPSCDTDYTSERKSLSVDQIISEVVLCGKHMRNRLVVITGGEPFRQSIGMLVKNLNLTGFHVQIETNGTLPIPYNFPLNKEDVTIVCSPKAGRFSNSIEAFADAFKYVLSADSIDPEDGLPILALNHTASPRVARPPEGFKGPIYLQPLDTGLGASNLANAQACVQSCLEHGYILQLQIHKIIGVA